MGDSVVESKSVSTIVGLIIAIIALLLSAVPIINNFAFILALISLVLGIIGIRSAKKNNRSSKKMAVVVVILSLLSGAIVLLSQTFYGNAINNAGKEVQQSIDKSSGNKTEDLLGREVDVTIGDLKIVKEDFNSSSSLPVKVTNKNKDAKSYSIQIEAVDAAGTRIEDDTIYVNNLGSNQSQNFEAFKYVSTEKYDVLKSAKFKVSSISQY
jgi:hypothetical protein